MHKSPAYGRILLKLSGESLKSAHSGIIDHDACHAVAERVREVHDLGIEIGIVIGGGNMFRGSQAKQFGFARTPADHVGMLATMINGLILSRVLSAKGCKTRVMSALSCDGIVESYNWSRALGSLSAGYIMIFVGGTGNPYFTTDTTAAMRASEIEAEVLLKGTKVDAIYNKDPMKYPHAVRYDRLSFSQVLDENLHIMDGAAVAMCRENGIPIHVFNLFDKDALMRAVCEKKGGTFVTGE
ncbi:MAG: UMP kinase [Simkaniaceae bacterium]|nr:UMP kinase [Simkaniaceae bacterium]